MNTPIHEREMDPAEQKRRAAARKRAEKLARSFGFTQLPGRPGFWCHEDIDPAIAFQLSHISAPVENSREVIERVFNNGRAHGRGEFQQGLRQLAGI